MTDTPDAPGSGTSLLPAKVHSRAYWLINHALDRAGKEGSGTVTAPSIHLRQPKVDEAGKQIELSTMQAIEYVLHDRAGTGPTGEASWNDLEELLSEGNEGPRYRRRTEV